jgi:hypothetical protein
MRTAIRRGKFIQHGLYTKKFLLGKRGSSEIYQMLLNYGVGSCEMRNSSGYSYCMRVNQIWFMNYIFFFETSASV